MAGEGEGDAQQLAVRFRLSNVPVLSPSERTRPATSSWHTPHPSSSSSPRQKAAREGLSDAARETLFPSRMTLRASASVRDVKERLEREWAGRPRASELVLVLGGRVLRDADLVKALLDDLEHRGDAAIQVVVKQSAWQDDLPSLDSLQLSSSSASTTLSAASTAAPRAATAAGAVTDTNANAEEHEREEIQVQETGRGYAPSYITSVGDKGENVNVTTTAANGADPALARHAAPANGCAEGTSQSRSVESGGRVEIQQPHAAPTGAQDVPITSGSASIAAESAPASARAESASAAAVGTQPPFSPSLISAPLYSPPSSTTASAAPGLVPPPPFAAVPPGTGPPQEQPQASLTFADYCFALTPVQRALLALNLAKARAHVGQIAEDRHEALLLLTRGNGDGISSAEEQPGQRLATSLSSSSPVATIEEERGQTSESESEGEGEGEGASASAGHSQNKERERQDAVAGSWEQEERDVEPAIVRLLRECNVSSFVDAAVQRAEADWDVFLAAHSTTAAAEDSSASKSKAESAKEQQKDDEFKIVQLDGLPYLLQIPHEFAAARRSIAGDARVKERFMAWKRAYAIWDMLGYLARSTDAIERVTASPALSRAQQGRAFPTPVGTFPAVAGSPGPLELGTVLASSRSTHLQRAQQHGTLPAQVARLQEAVRRQQGHPPQPQAGQPDHALAQELQTLAADALAAARQLVPPPAQGVPHLHHHHHHHHPAGGQPGAPPGVRHGLSLSIVINVELLVALLVPLAILSAKLAFLLWIFARHASPSKRLALVCMAAAWVAWEAVSIVRRRQARDAEQRRAAQRTRDAANRAARRAQAHDQAQAQAQNPDQQLRHRANAAAPQPQGAQPQAQPAGAAARARMSTSSSSSSSSRRAPASRLSPRYWINYIAAVGLADEAREMGLVPRSIAGRPITSPPPATSSSSRHRREATVEQGANANVDDAGTDGASAVRRLARNARSSAARTIRTALLALVLFLGTLAPEIERKRRKALEKRERLVKARKEHRLQRERESQERANRRREQRAAAAAAAAASAAATAASEQEASRGSSSGADEPSVSPPPAPPPSTNDGGTQDEQEAIAPSPATTTQQPSERNGTHLTVADLTATTATTTTTTTTPDEATTRAASPSASALGAGLVDAVDADDERAAAAEAAARLEAAAAAAAAAAAVDATDDDDADADEVDDAASGIVHGGTAEAQSDAEVPRLDEAGEHARAAMVRDAVAAQQDTGPAHQVGSSSPPAPAPASAPTAALEAEVDPSAIAGTAPSSEPSPPRPTTTTTTTTTTMTSGESAAQQPQPKPAHEYSATDAGSGAPTMLDGGGGSGGGGGGGSDTPTELIGSNGGEVDDDDDGDEDEDDDEEENDDDDERHRRDDGAEEGNVAHVVAIF